MVSRLMRYNSPVDGNGISIEFEENGKILKHTEQRGNILSLSHWVSAESEKESAHQYDDRLHIFNQQ